MSDLGVTASPPGSRPSDGAASSGVSTVPASIPNAVPSYFREMAIDKKLLWSAHYISLANMTLEGAAQQLATGRRQLAEGMAMLNCALETVEDTATRARFCAASGIEARRAETGTGSVHESPVPEGQTPNA